MSQDRVTRRDYSRLGESGTVPQGSWGTGVASLNFDVLCLLNSCIPPGHLTDVVLLALRKELCYLLLFWNINIFHIPVLSSCYATGCGYRITVIGFSTNVCR